MSKLIRFRDVQAKIGGLSRSTVWRFEQKGLFPKRRAVSSKIVVWDEGEVDAWARSQNEGVGLVPGTRKADTTALRKSKTQNNGKRK